ncbi:MAG: hypothetical protein WCP01_14415 [Methylococcaceae bacterium]|jgi:hypothetical protein
MGKASRKKHLQRQQKPSVSIKLSAALLELCEPFEPEKLSTKEFENLIALAAVAWNIGALPKEDRIEKLTAFIDEMPTMRQELEAEMGKHSNDSNPAPAIKTIHFIGAIIQRKDELFPEDNRFILDFNVKDSPEGPQLTVSSAPVNTNLTKK